MDQWCSSLQRQRRVLATNKVEMRLEYTHKGIAKYNFSGTMWMDPQRLVAYFRSMGSIVSAISFSSKSMVVVNYRDREQWVLDPSESLQESFGVDLTGRELFDVLRGVVPGPEHPWEKHKLRKQFIRWSNSHGEWAQVDANSWLHGLRMCHVQECRVIEFGPQSFEQEGLHYPQWLSLQHKQGNVRIYIKDISTIDQIPSSVLSPPLI
ncbi:MAG: hypothetical protein R3A11_04055 [Bdellovibrionota bacterium]